MKIPAISETANGAPKTDSEDPSSWQRDALSGAFEIGRVLADNLTRQTDADRNRQPLKEEVPWWKQPAVLIGGGIGLVVILVLVFKRR